MGTNKWSLWSDDSVLCIGCQNSVLSIGSIGSVLSIGSIGSAASILSIGSSASAGSALSAASRDSVMSAAQRNSLMGRSAAVPANIVGLGVGALLVVLFARRRRTAIGALTLTPRHLL